MSALSQTEFTGPCELTLQALVQSISGLISKKVEYDFGLSGTRSMDRIIMLFHWLTLNERLSGLK